VSLQAPWFLAALALIPLGVLAQRYAARRRRRYAIRYPALGVLAPLVAAGKPWRRRVPPALFALAVASLAIALARPERTVAVPVEQATVMMVTDASGSMEAKDVAPSRLAAAQKAALSFLDKAPDKMRIGLVAFSGAPHTVSPPSLDHEAVKASVKQLFADGGTATGDALATALEAMRDVRKAKPVAPGRRPPAAVVLLSDGKRTAGQDPLPIAKELGQLKIPVYAVSLGTEDGVVPRGPFGEDIAVPPDPETMRAIAKASGGEAFEVEDGGRLDRIYESLGSQLGTKREQREITAGFAGAGLALLAAAAILGVRRRGALP
jgi:Ca-activated chloride channel family protein